MIALSSTLTSPDDYVDQFETIVDPKLASAISLKGRNLRECIDIINEITLVQQRQDQYSENGIDIEPRKLYVYDPDDYEELLNIGLNTVESYKPKRRHRYVK